ncbi:DNA polymerase domain-containing protein [Kineosporia sp. J2-2]|uniref:DNA polymerase domain-containing protein n=1 Tax=Kineosporia corallincola TaxID=2835133 RepID=A0ABS5TM98_9ACTN|nr:DNA polymerase domain-containing protein [Kineosporia corallincola]MBT0771178.1 DNA polymerase domain-containing protein [Kineosporia corallincola]
MADKGVVLEVAGHEVTVTHPDKMVFPTAQRPGGGVGITKLDLVHYYLTVAEGALRGAGGRPMVLKRFVKGIDEEAFFQKRAPSTRPPFVEVAELKYASGRSAEETVIRDPAGLAWVINLGCIDLNPHPVLAENLDRPDELRIDLDPMPGVDWGQVVEVAFTVRQVLTDHGLESWPKTSGSRGFHIYSRVRPDRPFKDLRLAAETVAREVEHRVPALATARWWKEERGSQVFVDFNQMAKDRTTASVWSVRAVADARVSTPLLWDDVERCRMEDLTVATVLPRWKELGDPWAGIENSSGTVDSLLALAREMGPAEKPPKGEGRRQPTMPLIEVARTRTRPEALEWLEVWRTRHPQVATQLQPADVLVDGMRGRSSLWYRIRINLQHVPEAERPPQEELLATYDPWAGMIRGGPGEQPQDRA